MCFVGKGVSPEIMRNLFDVPYFGAMLGEHEIMKICENSVSSSLAPVSITGQ